MDHGVATFPQDGEQADQLIRVADERLYRLKHANHRKAAGVPAKTATTSDSAAPAPAERPGVTPRTISIETKRTTEKADSALTVAASAAAAGISAPSPSAGPVASPMYTVLRKAERVSMTGTNAYAVLGEQGARRARVLDLGFGGVALELDSAEDLPENMLAVLHVPILPPVRVNLKPVWSQRAGEGHFRIGCCFIS
jgi:hypothetical protein